MTSKNNLPVWYGGGTGNSRNSVNRVGHLNCTGFIIPKYSHYEYTNKLTNRNH